MKRLVVVTQHVDPTHPALAATVPKLRALASRVDELVVLAGGEVPGTLPPNCRVRVFAAATRAGRGLKFERALAAEIRGADAVLAHMCPIYAVLAAPLARPLRVPLLLWYTQWHASTTLRLAERVSTAVLSVDASSFPLPTRKLVAIGHGIDAGEFPCAPTPPEGPLRLIALGRYSPSKGYETILRGLRGALDKGIDVTLAVHGPASNEAEERHRRELELLAADLALARRLELGGPLLRPAAAAALAASHALVSATVAGAADKVIIEAALSCVPTIVPSHAFPALVPAALAFDPAVPGSLAERIEAFSRLDAVERARLGGELRQGALAAHTVESWADAVVRSASA